MLRASDKKAHIALRLEDVVGARAYMPASRIPRKGPVGGMLAWYDCADASSITTVSGAVSQWNDKSASGFNLSQGTAGDRPIYGGGGARTINGITCVEFVSADFLNNTSVGRSSRTQTAFVVAVADVVTGNATLLGVNTASGGNQFRLDGSAGLATLKEGISTLFTSPMVRLAATTPFVACQRLAASAIDHFLIQSGKVFYSKEGNTDSTTFTASRSLRVGVRVTTEGWDGLIGEIIIYDSTLTDAQVARTLEYLADKWGFTKPTLR